MMKSVQLSICLGIMTVIGFELLAPEVQAAGPAAAQQSISQVQTQLTEASVGWGWHRWRRWGYGGWGYGYGAYPYYGGYSGYTYVRPMIYSYPAYSYAYRPRYYTTYSYASPYCCGYSAYQPTVYGISNYTYSSPSYVSSTPTYSSPSIYSGSSYSNPVYSPSNQVYSPAYGTSVISSPTVITTPSTLTPTPASNNYQVPAPFPAPPVEIQTPSTYRVPVATAPALTVQSTFPVTPSYGVMDYSYSPSYSYTGGIPVSFAPVSYPYSPGSYSYPSTTSLLSRMGAGVVW